MTVADDAVWLDVLPSLAGFDKKLADGAGKAAEAAGRTSGRRWSESFKNSAGDSGSKAAVAELETAAARTKRVVDQQTADIARARASQKDAAAKVLLAEDQLAAAREKHGTDSARARAAELKLEGARDRAAGAASNLERKEESLRAAKREHREVTDQLEKATADLNQETSAAESPMDKLRATVGNVGESFRDATSGAGGLVAQLAAVAGGAALASESFGLALEAESGVATMTAALDLSVEESQRAGEAASALYADAWGESMEDVTAAVASTMSAVPGMSEASSAELEQLTSELIGLRDMFGIDVPEAASAAGLAVQNGLARDGSHAVDLLTASLQQVPESMRGEVVDAANEYGGVLASLGFAGEEAFGLLASASEGGSIAIDKTGDALKELSIRATDMSTTSVSAYEAAGLSAEDMSARFLAGGDTARGALDDLVAGLLGIEDPTERANAAIGLFGTPLEDLGVNDIPAFLESLGSMDSSLGDVTGTAEEAGDVLSSTTAAGIESTKRSFMTMLSEGIEPLLPLLEGFFTWATETPGVMEAVGVALGIVAVAWAALTLAASPWLALGVGIAAVVGGIVLAIQNWGTIVDWIAEKWSVVSAWIGEKWDEVSLKLSEGWTWIDTNVFGPFKQGFGWVGDKVSEVAGWIGEKWDFVMSKLSDGWTWIDTYAFTPLKGGLDLLVSAFETGKEAIGTAWNAVQSVVAAPINWVLDTVWNNGVAGVFNTVAEALGLETRLPVADLIEIPAYAEGGLAGRGWALVGEEGPELIDLATPGRVYTAAETAAALAAGRDLSPELERRATGSSPAEALAPMGGFVQWLGGVVDSAVSWVRGGLATAAEAVLNPIRGLIESTVSQWGFMGALAGGVGTNAIDDLVEWIRGKDEEDQASGVGGPVMEGTPSPGGWVRPSAGPITSRFGPRWGGFHAGIDIAGGGRTYAAKAGVVSMLGWNIGPGRTGIGILLSHGGPEYTYYGHNPSLALPVRVGDRVERGQHVGYQGATGNVTGVHLHFEHHTAGPFRGAKNPINMGVFDRGGVLKPGQFGVNLSQRPEAILTGQQWSALETMAARGVKSTAPDVVYLVDEHGDVIGRLRAEVREELGRAQASAVRRVQARVGVN